MGCRQRYRPRRGFWYGRGRCRGQLGECGCIGSIVSLMWWSSMGWVTDSPSSTGWGGRSLRVGDGKPSTKKTISLDSATTCLFGVPNPITASFILVPHERTHRHSVVKLLQPFLQLNNGSAKRLASRHRARTVFDRLTLALPSCYARMSLDGMTRETGLSMAGHHTCCCGGGRSIQLPE